VFGRTKTITIIDIADGKVKDMQILQNPSVAYRFGAGPILVKTLVDMKVNLVVASEFGPGALALIEDHKLVRVTVKPGTPVSEAMKIADTQFS
jgi:predicted Fe-Mo cluster-binding NifX family protein